MTRKETTAIALKCFAIYILSQVIISLPSLATLGIRLKYMGNGYPSNIWIGGVSTLSVILGVTTAVLIWKFTNSLMTKETAPDESGVLEVNGVMKIILACMGVYFIIDATMVLPHAVVNLQVAKGSQRALGITYLLTQILELTFGGILIAKPGKWVKTIRSIGQI